jgi:hypothetical protein
MPVGLRTTVPDGDTVAAAVIAARPRVDRGKPDTLD